MNWRRGGWRLWLLLSALWAAYISLLHGPYLFSQVHVQDVFGRSWLPWWTSLTSYVQPYADPSLGEGPKPTGHLSSPIYNSDLGQIWRHAYRNACSAISRIGAGIRTPVGRRRLPAPKLGQYRAACA
jgi:hypothetical protein